MIFVNRLLRFDRVILVSNRDDNHFVSSSCLRNTDRLEL